MTLRVDRTAPGIGNVTVDWRVLGASVLLAFTETSGQLFFPEVNSFDCACRVEVYCNAVNVHIKQTDNVGDFGDCIMYA